MPLTIPEIEQVEMTFHLGDAPDSQAESQVQILPPVQPLTEVKLPSDEVRDGGMQAWLQVVGAWILFLYVREPLLCLDHLLMKVVVILGGS